MRIRIRTADDSDLERILEIFARSGLDRGESLSIERAEDILKKGMFQIHPGCPTGYRVCMSLSWETPGDSLRSTTGVSETCLKKFETYPNYKVYVAE